MAAGWQKLLLAAGKVPQKSSSSHDVGVGIRWETAMVARTEKLVLELEYFVWMWLPSPGCPDGVCVQRRHLCRPHQDLWVRMIPSNKSHPTT